MLEDATRHLLILGKSYYLKRDYPNARACFEQVLQNADSFADVHNMLGLIYHDGGEYNKALLSFERALQINPAYTEAALNLAVVYNEMSKYDDAKTVYHEALKHTRRDTSKLDPFVTGKIANMHADTGDVYRSVGRYKQAIDEYTRALVLAPRFADIRARLASALQDSGDVDRAVQEFRQALQDKPDYLPARIQLGVCFYAMHRLKDALEQWQVVLNVDPNNTRALMYIKLASKEEGRDN